VACNGWMFLIADMPADHPLCVYCRIALIRSGRVA
jgi:hypothetical protein